MCKMAIKVYGSTSASTRKAKRWFKAHEIPFLYRDIMREPLSVSEMQHILRLTEKGTGDIIATRSNIYKELDLDFDSLSLQKLYELFQQFPRLLRQPLIVDEYKLQIGFDEHNIRQFIPREERRKNMIDSLFSFKKNPRIEGV